MGEGEGRRASWSCDQPSLSDGRKHDNLLTLPTPDDIDDFLDNATWAISSTYHTVLQASPGAVIFGRDMLFNVLFVADWNKNGEYRQSLTDHSNQREKAQCIDYDYKVGEKLLVMKEGILRKAESNYNKEPWTITTVHTNGTVRIQCRIKTKDLISGE
jgi:hypothetical protein